MLNEWSVLFLSSYLAARLKYLKFKNVANQLTLEKISTLRHRYLVRAHARISIRSSIASTLSLTDVVRDVVSFKHTVMLFVKYDRSRFVATKTKRYVGPTLSYAKSFATTKKSEVLRECFFEHLS